MCVCARRYGNALVIDTGRSCPDFRAELCHPLHFPLETFVTKSIPRKELWPYAEDGSAYTSTPVNTASMHKKLAKNCTDELPDLLAAAGSGRAATMHTVVLSELAPEECAETLAQRLPANAEFQHICVINVEEGTAVRVGRRGTNLRYYAQSGWV